MREGMKVRMPGHPEYAAWFSDPRMSAAVVMVARTGAVEFQMRWGDEVQPTVWFAVALHEDGRWDTAAGGNPLQAVLRLCEQIIDGAMCTSCRRKTGFAPEREVPEADMPGSDRICWYQWDEELATFRRGCEGDAP